MKYILQLSVLVFIFLAVSAKTGKAQHVHYEIDTLYVPSDTAEITHSPHRATMYSAVLPGLGQVYNGSWWKVPIVYGGLASCGVAIGWNNNRLRQSRAAYFDIIDNDPNTKSYEELFKDHGYDFSNSSTLSNIENSLETAITSYRRQRDLMIIATVGVYILNILDANVEAHFIDFDISEDLSLNIKPYTIDPLRNKPIFGAEFAFTF